MKVEEVAEEFIQELIEGHLMELRNEKEYAESHEKMIGLSVERKKVLDAIDSKQRSILVSYGDTRDRLEYEGYKYLYLAGIKDGMKLLKLFENM